MTGPYYVRPEDLLARIERSAARRIWWSVGVTLVGIVVWLTLVALVAGTATRNATLRRDAAQLDKRIANLTAKEKQLAASILVLNDSYRKVEQQLRAAGADLPNVIAPDMKASRVAGVSGDPVYDATLYMTAPPKRLSEIAKIEYWNQRTGQRIAASENTAALFGVPYHGRCLENIEVRVMPRHGDDFSLPFDMCAAWRAQHPAAALRNETKHPDVYLSSSLAIHPDNFQYLIYRSFVSATNTRFSRGIILVSQESSPSVATYAIPSGAKTFRASAAAYTAPCDPGGGVVNGWTVFVKSPVAEQAVDLHWYFGEQQIEVPVKNIPSGMPRELTIVVNPHGARTCDHSALGNARFAF